MRLLCLVGRHMPNRRRVKNDGQDFHAPCRGCGRPMIRAIHGWELERAPPAAVTDPR